MTGIINYDRILSLVYTEKTNKQIAEHSKYCFLVANDCTKKEIASLIKKIYNVKVIKINVIKTAEKTKRFKGIESKASPQKKAIVTLEKGQTINFGS